MRFLARIIIVFITMTVLFMNYPVYAANNKTVTNTSVESTKKTTKKKVTKK